MVQDVSPDVPVLFTYRDTVVNQIDCTGITDDMIWPITRAFGGRRFRASRILPIGIRALGDPKTGFIRRADKPLINPFMAKIETCGIFGCKIE